VEVQYRAGDILLPASGTFALIRPLHIPRAEFRAARPAQAISAGIPLSYLVRIEEKPISGAT